MKIVKEIIDKKEFYYINKYNIIGLIIYKFASKDGEVILAIKKNSRYTKIENKLFLKMLEKKFNYKVKTDIC